MISVMMYSPGSNRPVVTEPSYSVVNVPISSLSLALRTSKPHPAVQLPVGTLQNFLDDYLKSRGGEVDYIHGDDVTAELGAQKGNIAFLLPSMAKEELFKTVLHDGALPRKTFSMGHAHDKRYYVEARKIK